MSKVIYKISIDLGGIVKRNFEKETKNCGKVNEEVLFKILKSNDKSEIGIKFKFKDIKSIRQFKDSVPITEYKDYEKYINRMADGEGNVLMSEKVEYFGHTSGTTGKQKLVPCTKNSRRRASKYMALLVNRFCYDNFKENWNYARGMMIADIVMTTYTKGKIPICSATSGGMKGIKHLLPYLYTSPIEVMEIKDKETALYLHLLFGLEEEELLYISGVFISNILDLFRTLEKNNKALVRDIQKGSISEELNIDEGLRKVLNKKLKPNNKRAMELEKEFKKGFKGIAKRIWPNLLYIASVTGANFSIYNDKVYYYIDSIPIYSAAYGSTEAMIGINPYASKVLYVITPSAVFYEFIPIGEKGEESFDTLLLSELKLGGRYEVVITNYAGLYRYKIGDVVKVVGFYNKCPEIEFLYRKNQVLNMAAEKTNEEHLTYAIKNTIKKLNLDLVDYTTEPDNSITPGRYIFYFEFRNNMYGFSTEKLQNILDDELRVSNLAYNRARNNKKLGMLKVEVLAPNTFDLIKEALFNKGISKNQIKIPRVIINNKIVMDIINRNKIKFVKKSVI
ncbi:MULTISPECIES: GH3 auxin-responsive promoter family protein [Clostridium]|uniref:Homolog of plant auxin-responsive GH3-like protein n=1 Tax=Clostridium acetobutylicum (strain ATCC 824 / DSM 792 / JCM 1419 / IAM 19013 / LMG 5710 / NBRC 13948 / NRRL B-527 / VKM B-1787 / 2291 / W) TaxID=272562 RepID=Q97DR1_CLOAB|nr:MULTISPECIES: GH3 auxin-responsive promoter family protein [Clostridium]AAK81341.1 Homolog of plant auxin-responsive GH3-like protein [Clostridium acetobutylicum ATCC 824]AEI32829.1 plant auxin-responsive GH3-like protein [Clostridium acetobutylicum DSM 1731]AWV80992.1 plant auxin-responsive GH3 [Clostridium acetobutylicum]MBC2395505.1 GH3 auxin-responsive promoter family protein [Clostridium acetobutylicum]MBC2584281.1 GH3 auxin-responsive promoter family protein [Clostridium acetobutylicu